MPLTLLNIRSREMDHQLAVETKETYDRISKGLAWWEFSTKNNCTFGDEFERSQYAENFDPNLIQLLKDAQSFLIAMSINSYSFQNGDANYFYGPDIDVMWKDPRFLLDRYHAIGEQVETFLAKTNLEPGMIFKDRFKSRLETRSFRHSFSFAPPLPAGSDVIVHKSLFAVDFFDLGILTKTIVLTAAAPEHQTPAKFIGLESCAYLAAKNMVLAEMIKKRATAKAIIEVWYSSTWSKNTLKAFRKAVGIIHMNRKSLHSHVQRYIDFWHNAPQPISVAEAQKKWIAGVNHDDANFWIISYLENEEDRIDMARYVLTGSFPPPMVPGDSHCGSVCLFQVPEGTLPRIKNENFLHGICIEDFIIKGAKRRLPFFTFIYDQMILGIEELKRSCEFKLSIEIHYGDILDPYSKATEIIKAAKPEAIFWANTIDHFSNPSDFHKLAESVSVPDYTRHYGYSINWACDVFGTHIYDYSQFYRMSTKQDCTKLWDSNAFWPENAYFNVGVRVITEQAKSILSTVGEYGAHLFPEDHPRLLQYERPFCPSWQPNRLREANYLAYHRFVYSSKPLKIFNEPQFAIYSNMNFLAFYKDLQKFHSRALSAKISNNYASSTRLYETGLKAAAAYFKVKIADPNDILSFCFATFERSLNKENDALWPLLWSYYNSLAFLYAKREDWEKAHDCYYVALFICEKRVTQDALCYSKMMMGKISGGRNLDEYEKFFNAKNAAYYDGMDTGFRPATTFLGRLAEGLSNLL